MMLKMSAKRHLGSLVFAAVAALASAQAAAFSGLFVFGDSLSDGGNNALVTGIDAGQVITGDTYIPSLPYASGVFSNGPVWTTSFAAGLGLSTGPSLAGGGNFAFGGATTSTPGPGPGGFPFSLRAQVNQFLGATGGVAPADGLYVIAGGGNNIRATLDEILGGAEVGEALRAGAAAYAADVAAMIDQLQAAGASNIVIWNAPNVGTAPATTALGTAASRLGTRASTVYNRRLSRVLADEPTVKLFDVFSFTNSVIADPAAYGLTNVTQACGAVGVCDPATGLFWDGLHPTARGHEILAAGMIAVVPEPATYGLMALGLLVVMGAARRRAG